MGYTTSELVERLRSEGYQVTSGYLGYLLRECPILRPETRVGLLFVWQPADVARLKAALTERGRSPAPQVGQVQPPCKNGGRP